MARSHDASLLRYKIIFCLGNGRKVALDSGQLPEAVDFANRLSEGEWYEIYDCKTRTIVASQRTHGKKSS